MPVVLGLVAAVALALAFGPLLAGHVRNALNPRVFNDDARIQIVPFFRHPDAGTASHDVPRDYQLTFLPLGFKLLYRALAPVVDPALLSKVLPYLFLFVTLLGVGMAAGRLGGSVAAFLTLGLMLQTPHFLARMVGGLPRGFAFPLIALGFWALVAGRVRALAALAVVASAFYPPAAAVLGLMLGALLFIVPRADRGDAEGWTWRRRLATLVLVGALMSALVVPIVLATHPWGRPLGPMDVLEYPEIGPEGRNRTKWPLDRMPFRDLFVEARRQVEGTLLGSGTPLVPAVRSLVESRRLSSWTCFCSSSCWASSSWRDGRVPPAARSRSLLPGPGATCSPERYCHICTCHSATCCTPCRCSWWYSYRRAGLRLSRVCRRRDGRFERGPSARCLLPGRPSCSSAGVEIP